jgi:hypothetical protein
VPVPFAFAWLNALHAVRHSHTTHELGGEDAKKHTVPKMDLPKIGVAYTILVKPFGSSVQQPKVFSLPILLKDHLPFPKMIQWDIPLTTFKFKARDWKYLIEEY